VDVVLGHPMAGTERSGFESSDPATFKDRPFILIPAAVSRKDSLRRAQELVEALGARPVWMADLAAHDLAVALVSHLPHALAYALVDAIQAPLGGAHGGGFLRKITGPSYRDATRVAESPPEAVADYMLSNRESTLRSLRTFGRSLRRLEAAIRRGGRPALIALLRRIAAGR
jgi:prephenate dehydrogenase